MHWIFIVSAIMLFLQRHVPEVGQFVGDEVTVVVRLTTAGEVVPA